ncbi:hypothetical protein BDF22DRAFT_747212 [Syncephalis plumigaleata]|nr:hypothetical protein BDF22DRAFT_747212 [Syncephalis plumigaleata]
MNSSGPSGFNGAPVTKAALLTVSGLSILASIYRLKPMLHLQLVPHLTVHHQYWRLFVSSLAYASSGETLFGGVLLYHCRAVERQYGSSKYVAMLFTTTTISVIFQIIALALARPLGLVYVPSGPYGMTLAALYQMHAGLPSAYRFKLFGTTFSDKSLLYLLSLQLMIANWPESVVASISGLIAGWLYRANFLGVKQWRFPGFIRRTTARLLMPIFGSVPVRRSTNTLPMRPPSPTIDTQPIVQQPTNTVRYVSAFTTAPTGTEAMSVPSEEQIEMMTNMFPDIPRERIVSVLMESRNDITRAVSALLDNPQ